MNGSKRGSRKCPSWLHVRVLVLWELIPATVLCASHRALEWEKPPQNKLVSLKRKEKSKKKATYKGNCVYYFFKQNNIFYVQVEGGEGWERTQSQGNTVVLSTTRKEFDQNWRGLKQLLIFQEDTAKKINTDKKIWINQSIILFHWYKGKIDANWAIS